MSLLIDQSLVQIEQILLDAITLAFKVRKFSIADTASLRALASLGASATPKLTLDDLAYVSSKSNVYRWSQTSSAVDDDDLVIKPFDAGATGRWLKAVSSVLYEGSSVVALPTGVLSAVVLHNGDFSDEVLNARIYAHRPCVAIHFAGGKHEARSQIPGALYDYRVKFELWSVSANYRDRYEAALGSPIAAEFSADPGVLRVHGLVKDVLAGTSGADLGNDGINYVELGDEELIESDEAERLFVMSQAIEVRGSIHHPDASSQIVSPTEIAVQRNLANAPAAGQYDLANCVTAGCDVPSASGLSGTVSAGSALVGGVAASVGATPRVFSASSDTYRDLTPGGVWVFTAVSNGAPPPLQAAANLRVGVTVTSPSDIIGDGFLCSTQIDYPAVNSLDIVPIGTVDPLQIVVSPFSVSLGIGGTVQLTATARYADGSERDVTADVVWSTSDGTIATASFLNPSTMQIVPGLAIGIAPGSATLTATLGSRSDSCSAVVA